MGCDFNVKPVQKKAAQDPVSGSDVHKVSIEGEGLPFGKSEKSFHGSFNAPDKNAIFVWLRQIDHLTISIGGKPEWLAGISAKFRDSLMSSVLGGLPVTGSGAMFDDHESSNM